MTITPVDSIEIPEKYIAVCADWHGGVDDPLYAVCSTGGLTTGTNRPTRCDSDEKWYLMLWRGLSVNVMRARMFAQTAESEGWDGGADFYILSEFEDWADSVCEDLSKEYGLEDWEV